MALGLRTRAPRRLPALPALLPAADTAAAADGSDGRFAAPIPDTCAATGVADGASTAGLTPAGTGVDGGAPAGGMTSLPDGDAVRRRLLASSARSSATT